MTTVTNMKCACGPCLCVVSLAEAIAKDGQYFCSDACATGHAEGKGCGMASQGCGCGSK
jgi:metallothionein